MKTSRVFFSLLKPYKGKVIFYSTNNFAAEIGPRQESDSGGPPLKLLERYGVVPDPECPTYFLSRQSRYTFIAKAVIEDGEINRVSYIPCFVNKDAEPEIVTGKEPEGQEVFNYIEDISRSEGLPVRFSWEGDEVLIRPQAA